MPTYEYEYIRKDGTTVRVERMRVPMADSAKPIVVEDEDGETYTAERAVSLTANMKVSWEKDTEAGDLPPVDASPEDVKRMLK